MNRIIKVLQRVSDICERTKYCMECEFRSKNTGICVFEDTPKFWNFEEIENMFYKQVDSAIKDKKD